MTTPASTKIVIVAGQEFSVPADTDNEAIRESLKGGGFPDVAAATIQTGKKTIDGVEYTTVEFVKKAGTKGLGGAELAQLLAAVPPSPFEATPGITRAQALLIRRLRAGLLTVGEAVAENEAIDQVLVLAQRNEPGASEGEQLCARADRAPAAACATPFGW